MTIFTADLIDWLLFKLESYCKYPYKKYARMRNANILCSSFFLTNQISCKNKIEMERKANTCMCY